jgi:hypothetical protein
MCRRVRVSGGWCLAPGASFPSKVGPYALKVGEPLTAKFIPARNGSPLGFLKSITRADGTVMNISAGNPTD